MKYYRPTFKKIYPKFLVKIFVWNDGILQIIENEFNSRKDAFDYINQIDYIDAGIKVYNPQSELIHSYHTKYKNNDWELYT
jgi:hypothetical protein